MGTCSELISDDLISSYLQIEFAQFIRITEFIMHGVISNR